MRTAKNNYYMECLAIFFARKCVFVLIRTWAIERRIHFAKGYPSIFIIFLAKIWSNCKNFYPPPTFRKNWTEQWSTHTEHDDDVVAVVAAAAQKQHRQQQHLMHSPHAHTTTATYAPTKSLAMDASQEVHRRKERAIRIGKKFATKRRTGEGVGAQGAGGG